MSWQELPDPMEDQIPSPCDLEAVLRQAPLRQPSSGLDARVARSLARRATSRAARPLWMGMAALLAVGVGLWPMLALRGEKPRPRSTPSTESHWSVVPIPLAGRPGAAAVPLFIQQTRCRVCEAGTLNFADGNPVRFYRKRSIRNIWIINPDNGQRTAITIPTDELLARPIQPF
jgi:hypothetical protein